MNRRVLVGSGLSMLVWGASVDGAPVSEAPTSEPERPAVVPWSDKKSEHPLGEVLTGDTASRARPDPNGISIPILPAMEGPTQVAPVAAGDGLGPVLSPGVRLDSHSTVATVDATQDFPVEAVAVGMIVAGVLLGGVAWFRFCRPTTGR